MRTLLDCCSMSYELKDEASYIGGDELQAREPLDGNAPPALLQQTADARGCLSSGVNSDDSPAIYFFLLAVRGKRTAAEDCGCRNAPALRLLVGVADGDREGVGAVRTVVVIGRHLDAGEENEEVAFGVEQHLRPLPPRCVDDSAVTKEHGAVVGRLVAAEPLGTVLRVGVHAILVRPVPVQVLRAWGRPLRRAHRVGEDVVVTSSIPPQDSVFRVETARGPVEPSGQVGARNVYRRRSVRPSKRWRSVHVGAVAVGAHPNHLAVRLDPRRRVVAPNVALHPQPWPA
mmetsp:Transcript_14269/g.42260  ORF Transcript_14269/g.42260 Transcript_14269/m.42260 type:complete len:287 (+) Transcript_14269:543-1403(+)